VVEEEERALTMNSFPLMSNFFSLIPFQKGGKETSTYRVFNCNFQKTETVMPHQILCHNSKCLEKQKMKCTVSRGGRNWNFE